MRSDREVLEEVRSLSKEEMKVLIKKILEMKRKICCELNLIYFESLDGKVIDEEEKEILEKKDKKLDRLLEEILKICEKKDWWDVIEFFVDESFCVESFISDFIDYLEKKENK